MQQSTFVGVVQCVSNSGDNGPHIRYRHTGRVAVFHQSRGVGALDVVHRNPQVAFKLAAIMHANDVRVPQRRGQVGFALKSLAEFVVRCYGLGITFSASRRGSLGC